MTRPGRPSWEPDGFEALFRGAGVGMALLHVTGWRFQRVNPALCTLTGRPEAQLLGRSIADLACHDDAEAHRRGLNRLAQKELPSYCVEMGLQRPDQSVIWVRVAAHPVRDAAGQVTGVAAIFEDIEDRRAAEAALQTSEARLRLALEASAAGVWSYDPAADETTWDDTVRRHYGHAPETEPSHQLWLDVLHPSDRPEVARQLDRLSETPGSDSWDLEFRSVRPDGSVTWHHALGRADRRADGSIARMTGIDLDITSRKAAELTALETTRRLRLLLETAGANSWYYDPATDLLSVDGPTAPAFQLTPGTTASLHTVLERVPADLRHRSQAALSSIIAGDTDGWSIDYQLDGPDGTPQWYRSVARAERTDTGALLCIAGITIETTELETRNLQLRQLASELLMAEQQVREEIANTLHDRLQQLLYSAAVTLDRYTANGNPGSGAADVLLAQIRATLTESIEAARTLSGDLFPPELQDHGLPTALGYLARQLETSHHIRLDADLDPAADPTSHDRRIFIYEAARELLFNAIKHAGATRLALTLERTDDRQIRLTVADDGVGFDPEEAPQPDPGQWGLGLTRLRQRAPLVSGQLEFRSGPQAGTHITLTVPDAPGPRPF